jgi:hypothetical protein
LFFTDFVQEMEKAESAIIMNFRQRCISVCV